VKIQKLKLLKVRFTLKQALVDIEKHIIRKKSTAS